MSNLERRLSALEGGSGSSPTHEEWLDAMERADRGETIDWSKLTSRMTAADRRALDKLR